MRRVREPRPRCHAGIPRDEALAAIDEYEAFVAAHPADALVPVLRRTIRALRQELRFQAWIESEIGGAA